MRFRKKTPTASSRVGSLVTQIAEEYRLAEESVWILIATHLQTVYDGRVSLHDTLLGVGKQLNALVSQERHAQQELASKQAAVLALTAKVTYAQRSLSQEEERLDREKEKLEHAHKRRAELASQISSISKNRKEIEYETLTVAHASSAAPSRWLRALITVFTLLGALIAIWLILHKQRKGL